jgi:hypothetical protein
MGLSYSSTSTTTRSPWRRMGGGDQLAEAPAMVRSTPAAEPPLGVDPQQLDDARIQLGALAAASPRRS